MPQMIFAGEPLIRLGFFLWVFAIMGLWEAFAWRRAGRIARIRRWPSNLGIVVLDTLAVRLLFPVTAVGVALLAQAKGWGLLLVLPLPDWAAIAASLLLLDLTIYGQHVTFHAVPVLWRLL